MFSATADEHMFVLVAVLQRLAIASLSVVVEDFLVFAVGEPL